MKTNIAKIKKAVAAKLGMPAERFEIRDIEDSFAHGLTFQKEVWVLVAGETELRSVRV